MHGVDNKNRVLLDNFALADRPVSDTLNESTSEQPDMNHVFSIRNRLAQAKLAGESVY